MAAAKCTRRGEQNFKGVCCDNDTGENVARVTLDGRRDINQKKEEEITSSLRCSYDFSSLMRFDSTLISHVDQRSFLEWNARVRNRA